MTSELELENWFDRYFTKHGDCSVDIPPMKIESLKSTVDSHFRYLKNNPGNGSFTPYWERLLQFKKHLEMKSAEELGW